MGLQQIKTWQRMALALLGGALTSISPRLGGNLLFLLSLPFFLGGLAVVIAAPTARWGTTPGKFLFRLEVVGAHALPPTFRQAFSRELIKLLSLLMPFGLFLALAITVRNGGIALHDQATRTEVCPKFVSPPHKSAGSRPSAATGAKPVRKSSWKST
jgi:uncharacterized RDD family membrane protein YckC